LIPSGATAINPCWSVVEQNSNWFYFCGVNPVFFHSDDDRRSFQMFTAQLVCQGMCKQAEIVHTFSVSKNSVNRSVKKYRESGPHGFFQPRKPRGGSASCTQTQPKKTPTFFASFRMNDGQARIGKDYRSVGGNSYRLDSSIFRQLLFLDVFIRPVAEMLLVALQLESRWKIGDISFCFTDFFAQFAKMQPISPECPWS